MAGKRPESQTERELRLQRRDLATRERLSRVGSWSAPSFGAEPGHFSAEARRIFGFGPDETVRMADIMARTHPDDRARCAAIIEESLATTGTFTFDHRIVLPDGSLRYIRIAVTFEPGECADERAIVGVVMDKTEFQASAQALRENEAWLRAIVESSIDGFMSVDDTGTIVGFGRQLTGLLGWTAEEAIGQKLSELLVPPERRDSHRQVFIDQMADPTLSQRMEVALMHKSGKRIPSEISIGTSWAGTKRFCHAFIRDLTETRRLQTDLGQAQKVEAMGIVAGSVAHDFNNILAAISTFTTLAMDSLPPDGDREDLEQVLKATDRATRLTRQLLAFSRKQPFETRAIELDAFVRELLPMVQQLAGDRVEVQVHARGGDTRVSVDITQLELLLMNLVVNARDAMPTGGTLTIETAGQDLEPSGQPSRFARLSVKDTGSGIPAEDLPHIFDAFYTTRKAGAGTGLGLATVDSILKQNRGRITVRSTVGVGTAFDVMLPLHADSGDDPALTHRSVPLARLGGGGTVLLVEDDDSVRKACHRALDAAGYRVLSAQNAGEALMMAEEGVQFDLLLTDVALPRVSGPQLAERLMRLHPEARVLFISGLPESDERLGAVRAANGAFLAKPFTFSSLLAKVGETLSVVG